MVHFTFHATSSTNYSYPSFLQPKFMENACTNFKRLTVRLKCFCWQHYIMAPIHILRGWWFYSIIDGWWRCSIQWCSIHLRISGIIAISTILCRTTCLAL